MIARPIHAMPLQVLPEKLEVLYESLPSANHQTIPILSSPSPVIDEDAEAIRQRFAEREEIRQQLLAAGLLVMDIEIPDLPEDWDESDDLLPIQLPPNSKTIAEWLEEERGEY